MKQRMLNGTSGAITVSLFTLAFCAFPSQTDAAEDSQRQNVRMMRRSAIVSPAQPSAGEADKAASSTAAPDPATRVRNAQGTGTQTSGAHQPFGDPFKVPGLAARDTKTPSINVLRRIFLDPATGQLAFVGNYDPAYASGEIDYSTLLHDALQSPAPIFSLEPTPATKASINQFVSDFDRQMATNLSSVETGKAWLIRLIDLLLSDPSLNIDRQRFLQKGADILRVTPQEMPELTRAMLNRTPQGSPSFIKFWMKFYESAGSIELAFFMKAAAGKATDPDAFMGAIEWLGLEPLRQELRAKVQSGSLTTAQGEAIFEVGLWKDNFRRMRVPESRWAAAAARAETTFNIVPFKKLVDEINADILREHLLEPWLNGLVLSEAFLGRMHQMPPLESDPVYRGGLLRDSELARTFLEADWILKTLVGQPELARRVPGHLTPHQYLFQRETAAGTYDTSGIEMRLWLSPDSVPIAHDPDRTVLEFGNAKIRVNAEVHGSHGGSPGSIGIVQGALAAYGAAVTQRYNDYAKVLPELHRLREAAKILALVRWARSQGLVLVPPQPAAAPQASPERFSQGFWTAHFLSAKGRTFLGLAGSGGVDFGSAAGSAWVKSGENAALSVTALGQLAGSAALGREAVDAAARGDLDAARSLADQSARAMTGDFDFTGHPALGKIPPVPPPERVHQVELQTELTIRTKEAVNTLARASGEQQKTQAQEQLRQIKTILTSPSPASEQAREWVKLLRNGDWNSLSAAIDGPVAGGSTLASSSRNTTPLTPKDGAVETGAWTPTQCQIAQRRIAAYRDALRQTVEVAERFSRTIGADQALRSQWENAMTAAVDRAKNRAQFLWLALPLAELKRLNGIAADHLSKDGADLASLLAGTTDPKRIENIRIARQFIATEKEAVQKLGSAYKNIGDAKDSSEKALLIFEDPEQSPTSPFKGDSMKLREAGEMLFGLIVERDRWKQMATNAPWAKYLAGGLSTAFATEAAARAMFDSWYDAFDAGLAWEQLHNMNLNSDRYLEAVKKVGTEMRKRNDRLNSAEKEFAAQCSDLR